MELDKIYNMDCLEGMKQIPDGSVDAIICDLPYGTMKGYGKWEKMGWEGNKHDWDEIIPTDKLFEQYERVLRRNGVAILFSQEPDTSHLRTFNPRNMEFCYPMIWLKDSAGNALISKVAPISYFEDINVFAKRHDSQLLHPLRDYARHLISYIGKNCSQIQDDFASWNIPQPTRVSHFLRPDALQFNLCTKETYGLLISHFGIDKMEGFCPYEYLEDIDRKFNRTFNLPDGKASKSNVLQYAKDADGFHPTQKPVALIADLVRTYSNDGDTILDNCMGSGTTAVACI